MLGRQKNNLLPFGVQGKQSKLYILFKEEDMWRFIQGPLAVLTSTWAFPADFSSAHMHSSPL